MHPLISLCVIAKDEADFLPECLVSARGAADELIVVDTGSTDATAALARAAGARVVHHTWRQDFAAARNAAAEVARGRYLLLLDADERLTERSGRALRAFADSGRADVGLVALHNVRALDVPWRRCPSASDILGEPSCLPRLFRHSEGLRWEGVVHESPTTWLSAPGRTVAIVEDAEIVHYGRVGSLVTSRNKRARNLALLRRRAEAHPDDPVVWGYLALEATHAGLDDEAWRACEQGWRAALAPTTERPVLVGLVTVRAHTQLRRGEPRGALRTLDQARELGVEHPNLHLLRALALQSAAPEEEASLRAAVDEATRAWGWTAPTLAESLPGVRSWASATLVGELQLALGDSEAAALALHAALDSHPEPTRVLLALAEVELQRGRPARALAAVQPLLGPAPDAWILAAAAAHALGALGDARMLLERGLALARTRPPSAARARRARQLRAGLDLAA